MGKRLTVFVNTLVSTALIFGLSANGADAASSSKPLPGSESQNQITEGAKDLAQPVEWGSSVSTYADLLFSFLIVLWTIRATHESTRQSEAAISDMITDFIDALTALVLPDGRCFSANQLTAGPAQSRLLVLLDRLPVMTPKVLLEIFFALNNLFATSPIHLSGLAGQNNTQGAGKPKRLYWAPVNSNGVVRLVDLSDPRIVKALRGRSLADQDCQGFDFFGAHLIDFSFKGAQLNDAVFLRGRFENVNFDGADLRNVQFSFSSREIDNSHVYSKKLGVGIDLKCIEAIFDARCTFRRAKMSQEFYDYLKSMFGSESSSLRDVVIEQAMVDVLVEEEHGE